MTNLEQIEERINEIRPNLLRLADENESLGDGSLTNQTIVDLLDIAVDATDIILCLCQEVRETREIAGCSGGGY